MATATRVGSSRKFAHYEVVVSDSEQRRIALFTSSAYQLDQ
ncbi:acyl-CoA thioesterase [Paenacidovorax caeni]|uniref:Acyl-CoA thioesterase n=3 Tax=Comamonadaceae TaxID=80864 RepID=A0A1I7KWF3_9BURK|nr:acyl-CoA thioesterase [Paenacidovorax caeni]